MDDVKVRFVFQFAPNELGTIVTARVMRGRKSLWMDAIFLADDQEQIVRQFFAYEGQVFGTSSPAAFKHMLREIKGR